MLKVNKGRLKLLLIIILNGKFLNIGKNNKIDKLLPFS